jgi:hypothetical protein
MDLRAQLVPPRVYLMPQDFDVVLEPFLRASQVVLRRQSVHTARREVLHQRGGLRSAENLLKPLVEPVPRTFIHRHSLPPTRFRQDTVL